MKQHFFFFNNNEKKKTIMKHNVLCCENGAAVISSSSLSSLFGYNTSSTSHLMPSGPGADGHTHATSTSRRTLGWGMVKGDKNSTDMFMDSKLFPDKTGAVKATLRNESIVNSSVLWAVFQGPMVGTWWVTPSSDITAHMVMLPPRWPGTCTWTSSSAKKKMTQFILQWHMEGKILLHVRYALLIHRSVESFQRYSVSPQHRIHAGETDRGERSLKVPLRCGWNLRTASAMVYYMVNSSGLDVIVAFDAPSCSLRSAPLHHAVWRLCLLLFHFPLASLFPWNNAEVHLIKDSNQ